MKIREEKKIVLELTPQELKEVRSLALLTLEADERGLAMFQNNRIFAKEVVALIDDLIDK